MPRFVPTELGHLHVEVLDNNPGTRPLICWSALHTDGRMWQPLAEQLGSRSFVLIDPPGHGKSDNLRRPFSITDCAKAMSTVISALDYERVVILGQSWGGQAGLVLAARRPNLVAGLACISTELRAPTVEEAKRAKSLERRYRTLGGLSVYRSVSKSQLAPASRRRRAVTDPFWKQYRAAARVGLRHALTSLQQEREDLTGLLRLVQAPTVVVVGALDPSGREAADELAGGLRSLVGKTIVDDAGRLVALEQPRPVADALRPLLDRV